MAAIFRKKLNQWKDYKKALKGRNKPLYYCVEFIDFVGVALIMALLIRHFCMQSSKVASGSMIPTMQISDYVLVNKVVTKIRAPRRGEILLFESPFNDGKEYVKRLLGLPGDIVQIKRGIVYINDKVLVFPGVVIQRDYSHYGPEEIPEGHYFFVGDNRGNSHDSRFWGFVKEDDIIGKAMATFWPLSRAQVIR